MAPPSRAAPLFVFAALAAAAIGAGAAIYRIGEGDVRRRRGGELAGIVVQKAEQVVRWRVERLSDAQMLAHDPMLVALLAGPRPKGREAERELAAHLDDLRDIGDYTAVAVLDASGALRASAGAVTDDPGPLRALVDAALSQGVSALSDVHGDGEEDPPHLDVVAPIPGGPGAAGAGAVLLRIDPTPHLYRLVEFWHEPGASAEAFLVRPGPRGAVVLNRRAPGGSPTPLPLEDAVARDLSRRRFAAFEARDGRGVRVIGAAAPIPDTPWTLLVKEDEADTLAPLRERALAIGVAVLALVLAAASGVGYWAARQARRFERASAVAEAERAALAQRLERLTAYAQDMVFVADDGMRLVDANERAVELLGYPREELIGMEVRALRDPATLADFPGRVQEQTEHGAALFETRYRRKDGTTFPVQVSIHTEIYEGRRYFEAIARDLSDVERAEEALRESEAKFRAAFEHAVLGLVLVGPDGRVLETNRPIRAMTGHDEAELRGMAIEVLDGSSRQEDPEHAPYAPLFRGETDRLELPRQLRRKDGAQVDAIVRASALRDGAGALRYVIVLVEDVSEKKRLEAQLLLADRMASVGTLAAGVAHEINNPLAFILSNLEFAIPELRRAGADGEVLRALQDAKDGGARVREIVRDLRTFARPAGEARHEVDPRAVLHAAVGLASSELRHRAELVVDPGDAPLVLADEQRLVQVVVNLLINAAQAIPEGNAAENTVRAATSTASDGGAVVEVSDTGRGIAPDVLPRIFDPFFTTKPVGIGTGLGLSICHGIVSALGGTISVETAVGRGSTFRVHLPPAAGAQGARPRAAAVAGSPRPARRGRVLVIDDEPLVGRAVSRTLAASHDVVAVTSARAGLERIAAAAAEPFDAVLCDLTMPEMTGMELYARLLDLAPALAARTVFLTGGAFTPSARAFLERVPNPRLEKPFEPLALHATLARVLAPERLAPLVG